VDRDIVISAARRGDWPVGAGESSGCVWGHGGGLSGVGRGGGTEASGLRLRGDSRSVQQGT
jgi:hypothetical protein